jgi:Uma2 family endonuclease
MTGGTLEHARLAVRLTYLLTRALEGRPCRVYSSDLRVHIAATDLDTYPDASVVCGDPQTAEADSHALINPSLIVEVLSDSTEAYDRGQKASHYRRIPSLRAYLLVSQHEPHLELQIRQADGRWILLEARAGERLEIDPLEIGLDVDEVYREPPRA